MAAVLFTYHDTVPLKSMEGLHSLVFIPQSIKVNVKSLKEVNRLRAYAHIFPFYAIPVRESSSATKRKMTSLSNIDEPHATDSVLTIARHFNRILPH